MSTPRELTAAALEELVKLARLARERAYAPYSQFRVGAALLAGGQAFSGANVENASYGLTVCAERTAAMAAVSAGLRQFEVLVVVTGGTEPSPPCGACLQVLAEFGQGMTVVLAGPHGVHGSYRLEQLLPYAFTLDRERGPDE
ncbi:MAG TPA: cytidine deaminase [Clostridiales bacterium UBA8153]|nr:cytidine deaminase [Clostridiales bacterium UBA8153]